MGQLRTKFGDERDATGIAPPLHEVEGRRPWPGASSTPVPIHGRRPSSADEQAPLSSCSGRFSDFTSSSEGQQPRTKAIATALGAVGYFSDQAVLLTLPYVLSSRLSFGLLVDSTPS